MGMNFKEVGGGPTTGLANDFVSFLQQGLNTGSFGGGTTSQRTNDANPVGSTMGIAGVLNDILSGGAGNIGGSMSEMISKQGERDVNAMRARFGVGGGTAFGTGAQHAEGVMRSETAPKMTQAIGGLQLQALSQILPMIMGLSGKGITQRETIGQQNPWVSGIASAAPLIGMFGGPMGAAAGGMLGGMFGGGGGGGMASPNFTMPSMPGPSFAAPSYQMPQIPMMPTSGMPRLF